MLREYSFRKANTNYGRKERIMQVTLTHLPDTAAEFEALSRHTPEEVCACFLCALNLYIKDKDAGVAAMDLLRGPRPMTPYLGIITMLRSLREQGLVSGSEAKKIAARLMVQLGADIIISL